MPIYDYQCNKCNKIVTVEHGYYDDYRVECTCGLGGEFFKKIGNVGITFKGSGFTKVESANKRDGIPEEVWRNYEKLGG